MNQPKTRILIEETSDDGLTLSVDGNVVDLVILIASAISGNPPFKELVEAALHVLQINDEEE